MIVQGISELGIWWLRSLCTVVNDGTQARRQERIRPWLYKLSVPLWNKDADALPLKVIPINGRNQ